MYSRELNVIEFLEFLEFLEHKHQCFTSDLTETSTVKLKVDFVHIS